MIGKRLVPAMIVLVLIGLGSWSPIRKAEAGSAAYLPDSVKAAFLFRFGEYVEWPPGSRDSGAISIAILGAPAVTAELRQMLPERSPEGRTLQVRDLKNIGELRNDEILYIGPSQNSHLPWLITVARRRPVLIVTDAEDGLRRGAMINFVQVDRRMRFEVSLPAVERSGLKVSSRLLAVALRVTQNSEVHPDPSTGSEGD